MTTVPIITEHSATRVGRVPASWWLLPSVFAGAGIWVAAIAVIFF
jgi:hypothetical protein